ncbi:hypothetical protein EYR41_001757 [Orbilia oligospora]|uniref:Uncharacterized protein n=1 Tax=Orbilia oligospora TaxID=2813651 RepID=A0A8H2HXC9_ORBOL|nr:hypothetical protein EYR41_001757 [Orbilia oligospora]
MHILSTIILTITSLATLVVVAIPIPISTSDGISNSPNAGGVQQGSMSTRSTTATSGSSSREMNIKVNIKRSDQDSRVRLDTRAFLETFSEI